MAQNNSSSKNEEPSSKAASGRSRKSTTLIPPSGRRTGGYTPPLGDGRRTVFFMVIALVLIITLSILGASIRNVRAGHVMVGTKGAHVGEVKDTGFQWCGIFGGWVEVRVNTQETSFVGADDAEDTVGSIMVLTEDNLEVFIDMTLVYHLEKENVGDIIVNYGTDFRDVVLVPNVRSIPRGVAANYTAIELISSQRANFAYLTEKNISETLEPYHIIVESINIRDIRIPTTLMDAVVDKKVAEQNVLTSQYELEAQEYISEKGIVEAKAQQNVTIIEAEAQAKAIEIVILQLANDSGNMSGTEAYLSYIWMQALRDPNSNVQFVISDGATPIILDTAGTGRR